MAKKATKNTKLPKMPKCRKWKWRKSCENTGVYLRKNFQCFSFRLSSSPAPPLTLFLFIFPLFRLIKGGIEDLVAKDKGQEGGVGVGECEDRRVLPPLGILVCGLNLVPRKSFNPAFPAPLTISLFFIAGSTLLYPLTNFPLFFLFFLSQSHKFRGRLAFESKMPIPATFFTNIQIFFKLLWEKQRIGWFFGFGVLKTPICRPKSRLWKFFIDIFLRGIDF